MDYRQARAHIRPLWLQTEPLFEETPIWWDVTRALGAELHRRNEMTGEEIDAFIRHHCRRRFGILVPEALRRYG